MSAQSPLKTLLVSEGVSNAWPHECLSVIFLQLLDVIKLSVEYLCLKCFHYGPYG